MIGEIDRAKDAVIGDARPVFHDQHRHSGMAQDLVDRRAGDIIAQGVVPRRPCDDEGGAQILCRAGNRLRGRSRHPHHHAFGARVRQDRANGILQPNRIAGRAGDRIGDMDHRHVQPRFLAEQESPIDRPVAACAQVSRCKDRLRRQRLSPLVMQDTDGPGRHPAGNTRAS
jgi:hypothetical protein